MSASRQKKRAWASKFEKLVLAAEKANDDVLVAMHEAVQDELTQADIAYMVGGVSPSGVKAKAQKGAAILRARTGRAACDNP